MGVLQFFVIVSILNINLKVVQLEDLTKEHHGSGPSKSISKIQAGRQKSLLTEDPLRSKQIRKPTLKVGKMANGRFNRMVQVGQHSFSPPAEAVVTVPFDLNILSDSNPNSSYSRQLPSTRSSLPPCSDDQFACADDSFSTLNLLWVCHLQGARRG